MFLHTAMPQRAGVMQTALIMVVATWLPLFILSSIQGQAFAGRVTIPFVYDFSVNVRFLITLPLLIYAETVLEPRLRHAVKHFVSSGLVPQKELPAFEEIIRKTTRLRDGVLPTAVLVIAAFAPSLVLRGKELIASGISSWHVLNSTSGETLSLAGWWFALISVPLYRFILYRWIWVVILWALFLARVCRLPLNCVPTHPDGAAGLGFLTHTQQFFGPVAFAASSTAAATFANAIAYEGATVYGLKYIMIGTCLLILAVLVSPLLVLTPKLFRVKERGIFEYGELGSAYVQDFDAKWIRGKIWGNERLLGAQDIQALACMALSFEVVRDMKTVLLDKEILLNLVIPAMLPILVLVLVASPTDEIVNAILRLFA
jgi:hypothetical protein